MSNTINRAQLARYLAGETTPEETEQIQVWLETHPQARLLLDGRQDVSGKGFAQRDPEQALARLRDKIQSSAEQQAPQRSPLRLVQRPWLRMAAALVVLIGAAWLVQRAVQVPADKTAYQEIATAPGERTRVTLEDGTVVELSVASTLLVPEVFEADSRSVILTGEAFFDVTPDAERPFSIRAGEGIVTVLGTAFSVSHYDEAEAVTVVVEEGRVSLRAEAQVANDALLLTPGRRGRLSATQGLVMDSVDTNLLLAWRKGQLVFQGTPLAEVARTLERWYDVTVVLGDDTLGSIRLDAAFTNEPLEEVIQTIAVALDVQVRQEGQQIQFNRP